MRKVVHTAGWYYPDIAGGTEAYVAGLVRGLSQQGWSNVVAAPHAARDWREYEYQGTRVIRYPGPDPLLRVSTRMGGISADPEFAEWLKSENADIYHQHSWTTGCGIKQLSAAKRSGLPTVFTGHLPGFMCMRGTMLYLGGVTCDGYIDKRRCGRCWASSRGVPDWLARLLQYVPGSVSLRAEARTGLGGIFSALATRSLANGHETGFRALESQSDLIVAVCKWLYDSLLLNGIRPEKLALCRQGIPDPVPAVLQRKIISPGILKIGYLGRWNYWKGIDIVVDAVRKLPKQYGVELLIHGVAQSKMDHEYRERVLDSVKHDSRIIDGGILQREEQADFFNKIDLLVVPSRVLETGPMVVMEALASGVPVLGSCLGGIAELVSEGVNGWLVEAGNVESWSLSIKRLQENSSLLQELSGRARVQRTMEDVSNEMSIYYQKLIA